MVKFTIEEIRKLRNSFYKVLQGFSFCCIAERVVFFLPGGRQDKAVLKHQFGDPILLSCYYPANRADASLLALVIGFHYCKNQSKPLLSLLL